VAAYQRVNNDGCANQWQRHESEPNFRASKILCRNGADLCANRCAGVHDQCDQNVHVAFYRVTECTVTGRDDDLKKIGPVCEMRRNSENVNHRRHPDVPGASAQKAAE
jgi:hypothetical protein